MFVGENKRWFKTPTHKYYVDAHSRGVKCSQRGCAGEKWLQFQQIIFLDGMAIVMSNEFYSEAQSEFKR